MYKYRIIFKYLDSNFKSRDFILADSEDDAIEIFNEIYENYNIKILDIKDLEEIKQLKEDYLPKLQASKERLDKDNYELTMKLKQRDEVIDEAIEVAKVNHGRCMYCESVEEILSKYKVNKVLGG